MSQLTLTKQEREIAPKIGLRSNPFILNQYQKDLSKKIRTEKKIEEVKKVTQKQDFKKQFLADANNENKEDLSKSPKRTTFSNATTIHLNRILQLMDDHQERTSGQIANETMVKRDHVYDALRFLTKYGLITHIHKNGGDHYSR